MSEVIVNLLPVTEAEKLEFAAIAPDAEHIYAGRKSVTAEDLARATVLFGWPRAKAIPGCENLKWLQTMWAGADEYLDVLPEGATLTSSSGCNARSVAEHMLACTLSLYRMLPTYRDSQRAHHWERENAMKTLLDATVLVVGAGNIGSTFANMCKALGSHTIGVKRSAAPVDGFDEVYSLDKLDELLPKADVVALIMPHNPQSVGLMSKERIALMKDDAVLLSFGRGSVLDQDALVEAMQGGKLWGAALDVTEPEPLPTDHPLWDIPNLIITPHVAGNMLLEVTRRTCIGMAQSNLKKYLAGEKLDRVVVQGKV